ncbi:MAG: exo-alpha-sialidase, partial [Planctomycetota bacterium]
MGSWSTYSRTDSVHRSNSRISRAVTFVRTAEGHIRETRSTDDGKTWTEPKPTPLVHPDAPPMVFHLADGRTLVNGDNSNSVVPSFTFSGCCDASHGGIGRSATVKSWKPKSASAW